MNLKSLLKKKSALQYVTGNINPLAFVVYFQCTESTFWVQPRTEMVISRRFENFCSSILEMATTLAIKQVDGNEVGDKTSNLLLLRDLIPKVNPKYKIYLEA